MITHVRNANHLVCPQAQVLQGGMVDDIVGNVQLQLNECEYRLAADGLAPQSQVTVQLANVMGISVFCLESQSIEAF